MLKKRRLVILFFVLAVSIISICGAFLFWRTQSVKPQKVHYHAGFLVFQDDQKIDFSATKYMFLEPCTVGNTHKDTQAEIQVEKAHLHDNVGDVVHIERSGAIWSDLFKNIGYSMNFSKATGYINGKKVANFQSQPIVSDDVLVVFIGNNDIAKDLAQAPTQKYIEDKAEESKTCGE
jgi:hypothetical protein